MIRTLAAVAALALVPGMVQAQSSEEDKDLALIPHGQAPAAQADVAKDAPSKDHVYIENAASAAANRTASSAIVPAGPAIDRFDILFADARMARALGRSWTINYSGRANLQTQKYARSPSRESFRLDTREAYLSWTPREGWFLDAGRINLKSGVALGYNPTDFFKTRAVVEALSSDPSVLREDRLGAVMLRAQVVGARAAVTLAYAPRLYRPTPLYGDRSLPSFDPMLDRTNATNRLLLKVNAKLSDEFSPEVLIYSQNGRTVAGFNVTRGVGRSLVFYAEWAGGRGRRLIAEALDYGRRTGSIPAGAPSLLPTDARLRFMNDLALGASYTTASKIVFNLEYHYHQAGFDRADWRGWFAAGESQGADPRADAELWYLRAYAADQQEPVSRRSVFLRVDRQDAFFRNLELSGFADVDLGDGSGFVQTGADYFLSDHVTLGGIARVSFGSRRSEFGSQPQGSSLLVKVARYF